MRLTKHSGVGHEDIEYSYVVVRRGPRPIPGPIMMGRIGEVGRRSIAQEASRKPLRELTIHDETTVEEFPPTTPPPTTTEVGSSVEPESPENFEEALRLESFSWPRLVFPPLKRSGHIILDSCTAEGKACGYFHALARILRIRREDHASHYPKVARQARIL
jgi:hypothetical protein